MTPCSLYRLTGHNSTSSTSRSGPAEDTPHPTEPNADAPRPDQNEHDPPTIPADPKTIPANPDETAVENIPCAEKIIQRVVWTHFKKPSST